MSKSTMAELEVANMFAQSMPALAAESVHTEAPDTGRKRQQGKGFGGRKPPIPVKAEGHRPLADLMAEEKQARLKVCRHFGVCKAPAWQPVGTNEQALQIPLYLKGYGSASRVISHQRCAANAWGECDAYAV